MPKKHFYVPKKMYRFILLDSKFLKVEGRGFDFTIKAVYNKDQKRQIVSRT